MLKDIKEWWSNFSFSDLLSGEGDFLDKFDGFAKSIEGMISGVQDWFSDTVKDAPSLGKILSGFLPDWITGNTTPVANTADTAVTSTSPPPVTMPVVDAANINAEEQKILTDLTALATSIGTENSNLSDLLVGFTTDLETYFKSKPDVNLTSVFQTSAEANSSNVTFDATKGLSTHIQSAILTQGLSYEQSAVQLLAIKKATEGQNIKKLLTENVSTVTDDVSLNGNGLLPRGNTPGFGFGNK